MSTEEETSETGRGGIVTIIVLVLTNLTSISLGYYLTGQSPDPVEITCDIAAEVAASKECQVEDIPPVMQQPEDEAAIEAEEEAAENSDPDGAE